MGRPSEKQKWNMSGRLCTRLWGLRESCHRTGPDASGRRSGLERATPPKRHTCVPAWTLAPGPGPSWRAQAPGDLERKSWHEQTRKRMSLELTSRTPGRQPWCNLETWKFPQQCERPVQCAVPAHPLCATGNGPGRHRSHEPHVVTEHWRGATQAGGLKAPF